jgi:hypothetical protein
MSQDSVRDEYDDLADLAADEKEQMREWSDQFKGKKREGRRCWRCLGVSHSLSGLHLTVCVEEKYPIIGRLLKPGEEPRHYDDETEAQGEKEGDSKKSN